MNNLLEISAANEELYRSLYLIRTFEETVLENFPRGVFFGTTHTYLGQEANAVGVLQNTLAQDIVFSNHRCHGHFLAYGGDPRRLFAEMMGKPGGICAGRGGSQHLHWRNFYSNGILGGTIPIATGMALAELRKGSQAVAIAFLGDGTLGEGVVYESLNMASLWHLPILYVLENNQIAQTTPIHLAAAGNLEERFSAFGIQVASAETSDVLEIQEIARNIITQMRKTPHPAALVIKTHRFGPHSKGDDTRLPEEVEALRRDHDPVTIHSKRISPLSKEQIEAEVQALIMKSFQEAMEEPGYAPGDFVGDRIERSRRELISS